MNLRALIPDTKTLVKICLLIGVVVVVLSLINMVRNSTRADSETRLKVLYGNVRSRIIPINTQYRYRLRDYYIKSSYNSCCGGDFANGYVNIESLRQVIRQGCRCLDFEIYSVGGKAVVAASSDDNYNIKGTLNSLPISEVFKLVRNNACNTVARPEVCPNPTDPLFINLRIKSNQNDIYNDIANALAINFNNLLSKHNKKYAFECCGKNLGNEALQRLMGKVIIICDRSNSNYRSSRLDELVNMNSQSVFLKSLRNYDVAYAPSSTDLTRYNKKYMSITMPDYNPLAINDINPAKHHQYGCQFVCMNFQQSDANLDYYINLFEDKRTAFILKPRSLRYVKTYIPVPTPPDPHLSYGERNIQMPQFQGKM